MKTIKFIYFIGLLTNMYPKLLRAINKRGLMPDIKWDVIIDSSIEGLRKPQTEIFELARDKAGVNNDETLFVDNTERNVEAAKRMGWQTYLYDPSNVSKSNLGLFKLL